MQLRPYQIECLKFLRKWRGRVLIGDSMGIGKTVEGLSWLFYTPEHLPALIICPASTKLQWLGEWSKWVSNPNIEILNGITPKKLNPNMSYIINWDILWYWRKHIPSAIKTIIADECQKSSSLKARRTKALMRLAKRVPYFIPMSGTPIRSRPGQFFPILHMIDPVRFPSLLLFQQRYCNMKVNQWTGWPEEKLGGKNLGELNVLLKDYMIRREKGILNLPKGQRIPVPLEISNKNEYFRLEDEAFNEAFIYKTKKPLERLKNSSFDFKKEAVVSWVKDFLESEESLIVFAYHHAVMDFLENEFKNVCVRIDGSVVGKHRADAVEVFKSGGKQLMIAQIEAMGVGVDGLQTVCSACVFVEFGKNVIDHDQAESRIERSGQTKGSLFYYLIADRTIDNRLMFNLDEQLKVFDQIVKGTVTEEVDLLTMLYNEVKSSRSL